MANDVYRLLKAVKNEPMGVKPVLAEAVKHRRALVKRCAAAFEYAAGSTGIVAFVNDGDLKPTLSQQAARRQSRQAAANDNCIVFHIRPPTN